MFLTDGFRGSTEGTKWSLADLKVSSGFSLGFESSAVFVVAVPPLENVGTISCTLSHSS